MKKILSLLMLLVAIVTGAKATELVERYQYPGNNAVDNGYFTKFTLGEGAAYNSRRIKVSNGETGTFTVSTNANVSALKIKTIELKEYSSNKISALTVNDVALTKTDGKYTYTAGSNETSVTFTMSASGGNGEISEVAITLTDGNNDDSESLIPVSGSQGAIVWNSTLSPSLATITGSTSNVKFATSDGTSVIEFKQNDVLTVSATRAIKAVYFSYKSNMPSLTVPAGTTYNATTHCWTPANTDTKSVSFTKSDGSTTRISNIYIVYQAAGPVDPEFSLSANEVEVGKTISVNGPEGLEFTATPVGETTGEVSVSGGTITGVTAGAAKVQVTSSATDKYNAYDHTFDITVIAAKIATELSFGTPTTTVARGEEVTNAATLTAGGSPIEGTITYSSADETIATVDATGKVTGVKAGTTSIKANYAGDATYSAAEEVSYDITVTLPALTPVSDTKWTSASLMTTAGGAKDYTSADVLDNLEIVGTSTALRITTGGDKTIDGETFGGRVRFGKAGSADGNYVHFKVTPNSSITIWGIRATSGAEADGLAISVGAFGENEKVYSFVGGDVESMTYLYTGDADADVYAYSKNTSGASMMEIKVAPIQYETITTDNNVATYVTQNALDFTDLETKAYVVTGISNEKTYVTTEEVTIVPAGTALLVKGATVDVPVIGDAAAPATNLLQISTGEGVQGADDIFAYSKTEQKFKKVDSSIKVPAGKCYLVIEGVTGSSLDIDFNGATAVETIAEANDKANTVAPVKVIKGGQLFIGNYNVAGQLVK